MINFFFETDFELNHPDFTRIWIGKCIENEQSNLGEVNVIFCDDNYLLEINKKHLNHDYFTDIISFDYSDENQISGDIFISIDRVLDNANTYEIAFEEELHRVIIHGFLHYLGYSDHTEEEQLIMRQKEDEYLKLRQKLAKQLPNGLS